MAERSTIDVIFEYGPFYTEIYNRGIILIYLKNINKLLFVRTERAADEVNHLIPFIIMFSNFTNELVIKNIQTQILCINTIANDNVQFFKSNTDNLKLLPIAIFHHKFTYSRQYVFVYIGEYNIGYINRTYKYGIELCCINPIDCTNGKYKILGHIFKNTYFIFYYCLGILYFFIII